MRGRGVHLLGATIVTVVIVAIVALVVQEPRVSSQASPPAPVVAAPAVPATVQVPTAAPVQPVKHPSRAPTGVTRATHLSTAWGVDVSWPQCESPWAGVGGPPALQPGFAIVGVNNGKPFTDNPCLRRELSYARSRTGVAAYLNIDAPRSGDASSYGRKVALDGLARLARAGLQPPVVWLDVEVMNHWTTSGAVNVGVIAAAVRTIQSRGLIAGIYSSVPMWQQITGGARISVPVWIATSVTDYRQTTQWCDTGLGGRAADLAQYVAYDGTRLIDIDMLCPKAIPAVVGEFAPGAK